jgi:hypothetical protein
MFYVFLGIGEIFARFSRQDLLAANTFIEVKNHEK